MAVRNLTMHFVRARGAALNSRPTRFDEFHDAEVRSNLVAGAGGVDARPLGGTVPAYVNDVDEINLAIETIQSKLAALKKAHSDRLKVRFDSTEAEKDQEIDIITQQISERFNFAGAKLQRVVSKAQANKLDADSKIKKNIQRSLASKLQSLSQEFRGTQKAYLEQLKRFKEGSSITDLIGPAASAADEEDRGFNQDQSQVLDSMVDLAAERDVEIRKIVESVNELAVVFKELATMVIDQGTIIDRIDYNMEQTVLRVDDGLKQLQKAQEHQNSSRPMKCMILLVILIVIMLIILFVRKA